MPINNTIGYFAIVTITCFALACTAPGCSDEGPTAPKDSSTDGSPVMPLDVGNTWHYVQRANEPGAALVPLSRTITEHREIDFDGRTITVAVEMPVVEAGAKIQPDIGRLLRNEPNGLYIYGWENPDGTTLFTSAQLLAPRESSPGDSLDMFGGIMVCVADDSLVTTDFGEVTADVYELWLDEGTTRVPDIYVVPGVGLTRYYNREWTMWIVGYEYY